MSGPHTEDPTLSSLTPSGETALTDPRNVDLRRVEITVSGPERPVAGLDAAKVQFQQLVVALMTWRKDDSGRRLRAGQQALTLLDVLVDDLCIQRARLARELREDEQRRTVHYSKMLAELETQGVVRRGETG